MIQLNTFVAALLKRVVLISTCACASVYGSEVLAGDPTAFIISPKAGAHVSSPVIVQFGLQGAGVAPAGVEKANTGHHHLLIDTEVPDLTRPIPADHNHRHFGGGQTQVALTLPAGEHSLQLLLGNHLHIPHSSPILSEKITIIVD